jgi:hypothetical protein
MRNIAGAIIIVGLAFVSAFAYVNTAGKCGEGWGCISFLTLIFWKWSDRK